MASANRQPNQILVPLFLPKHPVTLTHEDVLLCFKEDMYSY